MGIGLGGYVDASSDAALGGLTYLQFLAPGPARGDGHAVGSFEATFPIIGGLQWKRTFHAMYATPIVAARHRARQHRSGSRSG